MKPATFDYIAPPTIQDAISAAAEADDSKFLAGGQSLVPMMALRIAQPELLIDLNEVRELEHVSVADGVVRIGALCRHRFLELNEDVARAAPLLSRAARLVGHPAIRNRGTLGGSLAHADPVAELPAALVAAEGTLVVRGLGGSREIAAGDFYLGFFTTALEPGELLVEIRIPAARAGMGTAFEEEAPRTGDFALAGVAAVVELDSSSCCTGVRLVAAGAAPTPVDLSDSATAVLGEESPSSASMRQLAEHVRDTVDPTGDTHASGEDRKELLQLLAIRAVRRAWSDAEGTLEAVA